MKIAVTGANGKVGRCVVALALQRGHTVTGIDASKRDEDDATSHDHFTFVTADLRDYSTVLEVLKGSQAIIHLAALPQPDFEVNVHNSNVVISYNMLRAAAELGINRIAQASSVNVIPMVYSKQPRFEFFPIDESHPTLPDEPYGLSKLICEMQADSIIRRYPSIRIASLRLSWSVPSREAAQGRDATWEANDLWGYVQQDSAADAFLLAATNEDEKWSGHERFFITAPRVATDEDSRLLKDKYWPDVLIKGGIEVSGHSGFFDCSKAERLLGWVHKD